MQNTLIEKLLAIRGAKFVSFTYRSKASNQLARYVLNVGASYGEIVKKSRLALGLMPASQLIEAGVCATLAEEAKAKVLASLDKTLAAHEVGQRNADYTKAEVYQPCGNGLQFNKETGGLVIIATTHSKIVLEEGVFKVVNSRPLTIATDRIRKLLPVGKMKEFCLINVLGARLNGETLELEQS